MMTFDRDTAKPFIKVRPPGPSARLWESYHHQYASRATYIRDIVIDRLGAAGGPYFSDVDGNLFLDFMSHAAAAPLGYNHPEIVHLMEVLPSFDPDRYAGCDLVNGYGPDPHKSPFPTPSDMHHKIIKLTRKFGFNRAFFSNSGAEAVENALKLCYNKKKNNGYLIGFQRAFHGRTLGALSVNASKGVHRAWYPQIPKVVQLPYCTSDKDLGSLTHMLDRAEGIIEAEEVAAIIIEPLQGEGGFRVPTKEFMKEVRQVTATHNIPLIMDEIQAGLGRSGKFWACEHFNMKPDILTASKGLRVGATIGKGHFFPSEDGRISSTWGEGNALASAVGVKTLEIIEKEKLVDNARKKGAYLSKRLNELQQQFKIVEDVRGLGLMQGMEIVTKKQRDKVLLHARRHGLLIIGTGYKSIRFLPPLDVREREIDQCIDMLRHTLKEV